MNKVRKRSVSRAGAVVGEREAWTALAYPGKLARAANDVIVLLNLGIEEIVDHPCQVPAIGMIPRSEGFVRGFGAEVQGVIEIMLVKPKGAVHQNIGERLQIVRRDDWLSWVLQYESRQERPGSMICRIKQ